MMSIYLGGIMDVDKNIYIYIHILGVYRSTLSISALLAFWVTAMATKFRLVPAQSSGSNPTSSRTRFMETNVDP